MILSLSTAAAYNLMFYDCTMRKLIQRYKLIQCYPIQSDCSNKQAMTSNKIELRTYRTQESIKLLYCYFYVLPSYQNLIDRSQ